MKIKTELVGFFLASVAIGFGLYYLLDLGQKPKVANVSDTPKAWMVMTATNAIWHTIEGKPYKHAVLQRAKPGDLIVYYAGTSSWGNVGPSRVTIHQ